MIHFAPQSPNVPNDPDLALVDEPIFAAAAGTAGIKHIFCGHTHVADGPYLLASTQSQVYCTGTATQYCAPAGNVMHKLEICTDGAGGEARVNWTPIVWNQSAGEFS